MRGEARILPLCLRFQRCIVGEIMKIVQFPIRNRSFSSDHVKKRAKIVQNERGQRKFYSAYVVATPIKTNPYQLNHRLIFQLFEREGFCSRFWVMGQNANKIPRFQRAEKISLWLSYYGLVFKGGGKIQENIGAIAPPLKRVKKSEIYPISPPPPSSMLILKRGSRRFCAQAFQH